MARVQLRRGIEFYSIKVENGPLTSRLQHGIKVTATLCLSAASRPGTYVQSSLLPAPPHLLSTGTGLAPFVSILKRITMPSGATDRSCSCTSPHRQLQYGVERVEAVHQ